MLAHHRVKRLAWDRRIVPNEDLASGQKLSLEGLGRQATDPSQVIPIGVEKRPLRIRLRAWG